MTGSSEPRTVLTFNSGSSSLKFGLYRTGVQEPVALIAGEIEALGNGRCRLHVGDGSGHSLLEETVAMAHPADGVDRLSAFIAGAKLPAPDAVGHRIVHGGPALRRHCLINEVVLTELEAAVAFAPLHLPPALAVIRYAQGHYPELPQAACFDTAFHAGMPEDASTLPLPAELRARGIRRYGFHGLSCESIVRQLGPSIADRVVIAHLGNGASITAVKAGRSVDTSMGLTPSGGVIMGTRTGDLDPGIPLYLLRADRLDVDALEDLIDRRSGLLGISGISSDMRRLDALAATEPKARLAIKMFRVSVAKQIAGMIVALGGIDTLVFTGGIGENDAPARDGIVERLSCCGVRPGQRRDQDDRRSKQGSNAGADVLVLPSREDEEIARHTCVLAEEKNVVSLSGVK